MSLIQCPECGKEISNKATSCPHCGYPILNSNIVNSYNVILNACGVNRAQVRRILMETLNIKMIDTQNIINNTPCIIAKNISQENAIKFKNIFEGVGASIKINTEQTNYELFEQIKINEIRCPNCGSNQITTGQRGFSFVTGFIGANKTVNRCAKCGYNWQPK